MNKFNCLLYLFIFLPILCVAQEIQIDSFEQKSIVAFCNNNFNVTEVEKPLHMDWIQNDIDIVVDKLNNLIINNETTDKILKVLPNFFDAKCNCSSEDFDYGYNLKSVEHEIHGGYGSYKVSTLYFENYILKIRIIFNVNHEILENYLLEKIAFPLECLNGQIAYEKTFDENLKKYTSKNEKLFIESSDLNLKRKESINYFTDVLSGGKFQKPFYIYDGLGSETFNNLRYFIVAKDYEALEEILFSPSPTSRQFAALTLRYLEKEFGYKPKIKINYRMKEILSNPKIIESGVISCWTNTFEYDKYDVNKNFEQYLITE